MTQDAETAVAEAPVDEPAEAAPSSLFSFSTWVHVGPGAEECSEVDEKEGTNGCGDPGHFHAFCRLPNPLQEREIRERAKAAQARRLRQYRKDGTDSNTILEAELEEILAQPDPVKRMSDELIGFDFPEDYLIAVRQIRDTTADGEDATDEDDDKPFEHIDRDRLRFAQLQSGPEEDRDTDEYRELQEHFKVYKEAVTERYEAIANPKRESYASMPEPDLVNLVRQKRIEYGAREEFMHHYNINEWLSCSYREPAGEPSFADLDALHKADDSVLRRLSDTFADLERTAQGASGN